MGEKRGPNKNKRALQLALMNRFGEDFHVVMKVADQAVKLEEIADADPDDAQTRKAALDGWDKVAQYVEPKLKAIEHTGGQDEDGLPQGIKIEIIKSGA